jgi:hypothetical protein
MTVLARHISTMCLLGVASFVFCADVRAETSEAKKRAFAEHLARRAHPSHVKAQREAVEAGHHHLARLSLASTSLGATTNAFGIPPATPIAPTGNGPGRDAFVNALYSEFLDRSPIPSEAAYWTGFLAPPFNVSPQIIANHIGRSKEAGIADTGVTPRQGYRRALLYSESVK